MLKIGILSFGEAASQIAEYAHKKGFSVVVANTAKLDLNKIKNIEADCKIHLEGWEGAGRNRDEGKQAAVLFAEKISEKAKLKLQNCDLVLVAASCGGGTGSGALPVGIEIISEFKEYVSVITILPEAEESIRTQMNTLECFSELSQYEQLSSVFIIDNEKIKNVYKEKNKRMRYEISNSNFIDHLFEICSLTGQNAYLSNFDKNDLLDIISERGCASVSKLVMPVQDIKNEVDMAKAIQHSWLMNPHPTIEEGQIVKAAILAKIPEQYLHLINKELIFEHVGMPYDIMEGFYQNTGNENHFTIYTILSGLSFPNVRLNQIESISQNAEQKIVKQIEVARKQNFSTSNWTSKFSRNSTNKKESLKDRLERFK